MMVPKDSYGVAFDNEIRRTGHIYPAMVSNSLWALCDGESTKDCKLFNINSFGYFQKKRNFQKKFFFD